LKELNFDFPLDKFEELIIKIGWESLTDWINYWDEKKEILEINKFWDKNAHEDWIWGLALPLLSRAIKFNKDFSERKLIGISALPGTGKSTLGNWLEFISLKFNIKIAVISIDDFYLPSEEMESAINNNPWNVSRGFPGTHSIELMDEKLNKWKLEGKLNVPVFDKSLRNGLGDRSHWRDLTPDLLIIEGWFLGVRPLTCNSKKIEIDDNSLSDYEFFYRGIIQDNLKQYLNIWNQIDELWHIKPQKFEYMNLWKSNQEKEMLRRKGNALKDEKLNDFLRMLNVSLPRKSFDLINSDVLMLINQDRKLINVGLT